MVEASWITKYPLNSPKLFADLFYGIFAINIAKPQKHANPLVALEIYNILIQDEK